MRRFTAVLALGLTLSLALVAPADAAGGNRSSLEDQGTLVVNDLCPFPVTVTAHIIGSQTIVNTGTGTIVRAHINEVDTFEANGKSVTGGPYTWNLQVRLDADGNTVGASQTGNIVRIELPNGEEFFVAGRADVLTAATDYISVPTAGVSKNRDVLCAYLAG